MASSGNAPPCQPINDKLPDQDSERESVWSVGRKWLPWCLGTIFALTIGWTAFIAWVEVKSGKHDTISQTAIAVVKGSSPAAPLIVIYTLFIITALDTGGSGIMVTYRFLERKILKPQAEKLRAEGREQGWEQGQRKGRDEERQVWTDWNRRRVEAEERGEPFNEPPPGEGMIHKPDQGQNPS